MYDDTCSASQLRLRMSNSRREKHYLAPGVFYAVTDGFGVFLDLGRDNYSAVPLQNAPMCSHARFDEVEAGLLYQLKPHLTALVSEGLLVSEGEGGPGFGDFRRIMRGERELFDHTDQRAFGLPREVGSHPDVGLRDTAAVLWSCWRASRLLEARSISDVIEQVRARKVQVGTGSGMEEVRRYAEIFHRIRPFYNKGYRCLFDSLALITFLADRGSVADWIFGVQLRPFGAHCWITRDDTLLNESAEYAQQFTPIMCV